jgi:hypothetical protein
MQCACAILLSVSYPDHSISPHYLINGKIFEKKNLLNTKCVSTFSRTFETFLGAFAKTAKSDYLLLHVRPSVRLSVRMEQLCSHWTDFNEILYLIIFEKLSTNFKFHQNRTRKTGTLHGDQYTCLIISRSVLRRMKNISEKFCRENYNTHFVFSNFFSKILPFMRL